MAAIDGSCSTSGRIVLPVAIEASTKLSPRGRVRSRVRVHQLDPARDLSGTATQFVSLVGGSTDLTVLPIRSVTVTLSDGQSVRLDGKVMADALQYGPSPGYAPLMEQLRDMQKRLHDPPNWSGADVIVTTGTQDGLSKVFEMMLDVNDYVIVQEPTYAGALAVLKPFRPKYVTVGCDAAGLIPDQLRSALESRWKAQDASDPTSDIPKLLYLNPTGCNPTGISISLERRKEIYRIAQEFDLIILEDDPFYYVQFTEEKIPSFLSMDVDGRVIRFDSMSKVLSSGIRIGFLTGPRQLLDPIAFHMSDTMLNTPSLTQVMASQLLEHWGPEGFARHADRIRHFHLQQRDAMLRSAEKHLTGLAEWNVPQGGMFLWIKCLGLQDTESMVLERAVKRNVLLVPGKKFSADPTLPCPYVRAAFSSTAPDKIDRALGYLADVIRQELQFVQGTRPRHQLPN